MANTQSSFSSRMILLSLWISIILMYAVTEVGCQGITLPEGTRVTGCYGSDTKMSVSCSTGKVAISGFYYGFKPLTPNCNDENTCCTYDKNTDCLEAETSTSTVMDESSGQSSGLVSTSNKVGQTCSSDSYHMVSTYNVLVYQCLNGGSIFEMCTIVSLTSAPGDTIYLWNRAYTTSGIIYTDTSCNCSVASSSHTSDITIYVIHMDLYDDPTDCQQNITVSDSSGIVLHTFKCETPQFNTIQTVTVPGPYIIISLTNFLQTNAGMFWIGFQATEVSSSVTLICPAKQIPDCPSAENTTGVMVTVNGTSYKSVATYTCTHGYEHAHGDVTRTCQADGTWSGSERKCLFDCGPLPPPEYGKVTSSGTLAGSTVIIICDEGFTLRGSSQRTCVEKRWKGTEAVCLRDCPVPENTTTVTVTTDGLDHGSQATYTCVSDYVHDSGDQTVTCQTDGTWSGTALKCTEDAPFDQPLITILALACSGTLAVTLICVLVAFIRARRAYISNNIRDNEITVHPSGPAAESDIQIQMVEDPENVYHTIYDNANEYETLPPGRTTHETVYTSLN